MTAADVIQSALDPAGPQAAHISWLWWLMFWISTAVFVLVIGFLAAAVFNGRRRARLAGSTQQLRGESLSREEARSQPLLTGAVSVAIAVTVLTLSFVTCSMRS